MFSYLRQEDHIVHPGPLVPRALPVVGHCVRCVQSQPKSQPISCSRWCTVRRVLPTTIEVSVQCTVRRELFTLHSSHCCTSCTLDNFSRRCTLSPLTAVHVAVRRVLELLQLLTLVYVMHPLMTSWTLYRSG